MNLGHNIAGFNTSFLDHAKIKSGSSRSQKLPNELGLLHPNAELEARDSGLSHFENRRSDLKSIANRHVMIAQALDGEVFSHVAGQIVGFASKV